MMGGPGDTTHELVLCLPCSARAPTLLLTPSSLHPVTPSSSPGSLGINDVGCSGDLGMIEATGDETLPFLESSRQGGWNGQECNLVFERHSVCGLPARQGAHQGPCRPGNLGIRLPRQR